MLRAIQQLPKTFASGRLFCSAVPPVERRPVGHNRVTLAGEIITEPKVLSAGNSSFLLRTRDEANQTTVHRIHTKFADNIASGQHAYLTGRFFTTEYANAGDKPRYEATVKVNELSVINPVGQCVNLVELKAAVFTNLLETSDFTMFRVFTRFVARSNEELITQFMPVFVYDDELRGQLAETAQRGALLRIVGSLNANVELNKEGQRRHAVHIKASNIMTVARLNRFAAADDDTSSESSSSSSDDERVPDAEKQPTRE